jgi:hypothetical protein
MRRETSVPWRLPRLFETGVGLVVTFLEAVGFWATILFPLFYVGGYLAVSALPDLAFPSATALWGLLALNLLALVVGHRYDRTTGAARSGAQSVAVEHARGGD